jgi:hypothetical protein
MDHVQKLVADNVLGDVMRMGQRSRLFGDRDLRTAGTCYVEVKRPKGDTAMIRVALKGKTRYFRVKVEEVF